jgi:hypothetical protein
MMETDILYAGWFQGNSFILKITRDDEQKTAASWKQKVGW